jgi:hypothetical protein
VFVAPLLWIDAFVNYWYRLEGVTVDSVKYVETLKIFYAYSLLRNVIAIMSKLAVQ